MKISVVMQVYLGDYPGSRSYPKKKFVRAIMSFLNQNYNDKELIIVSDGCPMSKKIYETIYVDNPLIKFFYVKREKGTKSMYEVENGLMHFRGSLRQYGCDNATGDIITYMDSDDIMLPNHLNVMYSQWIDLNVDIKVISNNMRVVHKDYFLYDKRDSIDTSIIDLSAYGIHEEFKINRVVLRNDKMLSSTYAISHRKNIGARWKNIVQKMDNLMNSEDVTFVTSILKESNFNARRYESPTYVLCHYNDRWDC